MLCSHLPLVSITDNLPHRVVCVGRGARSGPRLLYSGNTNGTRATLRLTFVTEEPGFAYDFHTAIEHVYAFVESGVEPNLV